MRQYRVKPIRGLARGLAVLAALQAMRAASLQDLYRVTSIPKATLTRILFTLFQQGMVWQRMADGAYLASHPLHGQDQFDADWLVEIASPVLESLCQKVRWPSVLSIPRLDHMEVLETNSPKSYFDAIPLGPIGFRANILRSASGRAYLSFYSKTRSDVNDERNSIAMPIRLGEQVIGCVNLTWKARLTRTSAIVERHLGAFKQAVDTIERQARNSGLAA